MMPLITLSISSENHIKKINSLNKAKLMEANSKLAFRDIEAGIDEIFLQVQQGTISAVF